jgi:ROS/MUCR transcriptional regulator protein
MTSSPAPRRRAADVKVTEPDLPPAGQLVASDDGTRVQCHICGRWYAVLGIHAAKAHGMGRDQYREEFGLNRSTGLCSPAKRAEFRDLRSELLSAVRPEVNRLFTLTPEQRNVGRHRPKRLQTRTALGEKQRAHQEEHPQLRRERAPKPTRPGLEHGPRRLAELHQDPAWRARWMVKVRHASILTDDQILYVRSQDGKATRSALAAELGVSGDVISKVWRGDLRPMSELLAALPPESAT